MQVKIHNARLCDGQLVSIELAHGLFKAVTPQAGLLVPNSGVMPLAAFAERSYADNRHSSVPQRGGEALVVDAEGSLIVPAGIDVHVHSRDPGHPAKEDWQSLAQAAYKGGVVAVADMPNTAPPTMWREQVIDKAQRAEASGLDFRLLLGVAPDNIGTIADLLDDPQLPLAGLKVYYGQSTGNLMFDDLAVLARALPNKNHKAIVFHSEDQCRIDAHTAQLPADVSQQAGNMSYAVHSRIRDSESAWRSTETILEWARTWKRPIHIAHVSTPHEMELIAAARALGAQVTSEVAPHHLLLSTDDYAELGGYLKVNPPVRSLKEVQQLRGFFAAGGIDCFATDHAPHTRSEKEQPYLNCPSGLPAIEFFWPLFYTCVQSSGAMLANCVRMVGARPAELFGFPRLGAIAPGYRASFVWLDEQVITLTPAAVSAKCGWSPYVGRALAAQVRATWHDGWCRYLGAGI